MSRTYIPARLRKFVIERAQFRCEYCLILEEDTFFSHEIDHILAEKHGGRTTEDNLALSCGECNCFKGSDLGSFDPLTGEFSFLFNPRTQNWVDHFSLTAEGIVGLSPEGRTTARLLRFTGRVVTLRQIDAFAELNSSSA